MIFEILALQQAQEQSKGYFVNVTYDAQIEETVCRRKTSKFFFYFSEKIHQKARIHVTVFASTRKN